MGDFQERLGRILRPEQIHIDEPMDRHTTFRVGGPADYFAEPENAEELAEVMALCREASLPVYLLGNGSNLLVGDRGYRGCMVTLTGALCDIRQDRNRLYAGAGALLSSVSRQALKGSLAGLEFASGIPGTVGGAVVMNAGAYGSEMKDVLAQVTVLTPAGEVKTLPVSELQLGYRTSCIPARGYIVLEAVFSLEPGEEEAVRRRMQELAEQRKSKQPLEYPSAGSTFKRPAGYFAGKLIQDAGLRGFTAGGAQVSEKHCGFVINRGGATAADILRLCRQVQQRVRDRFGVELELEVKTIGEFDSDIDT